MMGSVAIYIGVLTMPPSEYRYEPLSTYEVVNVHPSKIHNVCESVAGPTDGIYLGCTDGHRLIFIRTDLAEDVREAVIIHEKAHINGWYHN